MKEKALNLMKSRIKEDIILGIILLYKADKDEFIDTIKYTQLPRYNPDMVNVWCKVGVCYIMCNGSCFGTYVRPSLGTNLERYFQELKIELE